MSRIGKKVIEIPEKTEISVVNGLVSVKGPKGSLSRLFTSNIDIVIADKTVTLTPAKNSVETHAIWGTFASHIINMMTGVNEMFTKKLVIEGIGYKAEVKGNELVLALGFSHPIKVTIPSTLKVTSEKGIIAITGIDKEEVGQFAANIRAYKKPEPYKGKGIRYEDEVVRRKQGKKSA
ncbi:MAG: 50S ribosomal protein L6 [bacterium]|nr:50S ribosomal protein L6 [bacterium]